MLRRRIEREEALLAQNTERRDEGRVVVSFHRINACFSIKFAAPAECAFAGQVFRLECTLDESFPYEPPAFRFGGDAPPHPAYADADVMRATLRAMHDAETPCASLVEWVRRIVASLK